MSELQGRLRVHRVEHVFDGNNFRLELADDGAEFLVNLREFPLEWIARRQPHRAGRNAQELPA
jgi:hypothetical protein